MSSYKLKAVSVLVSVVIIVQISVSFSIRAAEGPIMPVQTVTAVSKTVPVYLKGMGHLEAFSVIDIKSRIDGRLERILCSDGAEVEKGQLLFEIDTVPYKLAVRSAQANLERELAGEKDSKEVAGISSKLYQKSVIAKEKMDQEAAAAEEATASVAAARAELDQAKQNLDYCSITAPITGVVGRKKINEGNLISAYKDVLISLSEINRLKILFSLPAAVLRDVRSYYEKQKLEVVVTSSEFSGLKLEGKVDYVGNLIDTGTGMFELQAELDNAKNEFWPGEFVEVKLILTRKPGVIVIPERAVINGRGGKSMVYIIKDNKAQLQEVKVGWELDNNELTILSGIEKDQQVVVSGVFKLYPSAQVKVVTGKEQK